MASARGPDKSTILDILDHSVFFLRMTTASMSRRTVLALPALLVGACATGAEAPGMAFAFRDGIGRRAAGPRMWTYADPLGNFPRADQRSMWRPSHIVDSFSRLDEILPARFSRRGDTPLAWRRATREPDIAYMGAPVLGAGQFGLTGYMDRNPATGLLVAQDDVIQIERYQYGRSDTQRMTSFSMAKTVIAMMIGIAIAEGRIGSLDTPAEAYVPALRGLEYGATPLRHLLTMSSGVQFQEGSADSAGLTRATTGHQSEGGPAALAPFNMRIAVPGARWNYASSETYVLAMVLRAAVGISIADYFADRIWGPIGAEADASWLIDRSGLEVGFTGLQARLRDYAKLGLLMARNGRAGQRVLIPAEWVTEMTRMHIGPGITGGSFGYGYQTWIFREDDGSFAFQGYGGQRLFVHPASRLVMVHTAVRAERSDPGVADTNALWRGVRSTLS
jgi:CubicO group peptidase (beta-lactamase class C family)